MSFRIEPIYILDLENFSWEDWRAITINKEKRRDSDYYFAAIVKFYGNDEGSYDYDIGNKTSEHAFIGRKEVFVGERGFDKDPESSTFGQRITFPAQTEKEEYLENGITKTRTNLIKGKRIFEFTLPVNDKNTANMKKLVGPLSLDKSTTFKMLAGTERPIGVTESVFFTKSVEEIMTEHLQLLSGKQKKNVTKH